MRFFLVGTHELRACVRTKGSDGRCSCAPFPRSVKAYNLLFLELTLCTACLLSGRAECLDCRDRAAQLCNYCVAGAMAHTRAGPSSLLCKSTLVSLPLAQELNTEEGGTLKCLFMLETCLETVSFSSTFHSSFCLPWGGCVLKMVAISPGLRA